MTELSKDVIENSLAGIEDRYLGKDLISAGVVKDIGITGNKITVDIQMGYPAGTYADELKTAVSDQISAMGSDISCEVNMSQKIQSHSVQKTAKAMANIKNTIAVASGKGGVGKSTTAVNLAMALQLDGAQVGILDADIYGPSQPRMLGCSSRPGSEDGKTMEPNISYQVQSMSIGYLINEEDPMIWRGPMVTSALTQLITDTNWNDLDYLIIDMPPGTGDIQLTLSQSVPLTGAVIVTTPQDIALLDARKGLKMFQKVEVPVLGIIENMTTHICSQCGHEEPIFGAGGGEQMALQYDVDLLGQLPLDMSIREGVDQGKPTVALEPESKISMIYRDIARKTAAKMSLRAKDYSGKFPKIVVQNN